LTDTLILLWTIESAKLARLGNRASTLCIRLPNSRFRPVA
jgi:hypothetical protein